jgi:hypothetical protein
VVLVVEVLDLPPTPTHHHSTNPIDEENKEVGLSQIWKIFIIQPNIEKSEDKN